MKEERNTTIPQSEYLTPSGPFRFYFNHEQVEREETTIHTADFVEVDELIRDNVIVALIRLRYSINDEAAILRKKLSGEDLQEFEEYNGYVNWCKHETPSL